MDRIHNLNVTTYWTERGNGAPTTASDKIGGNIIVEVEPNSTDFRVKYGTSAIDAYKVWNPAAAPTVSSASYAWSKKAAVYHYAQCKYVKNISAENLENGTNPPANKDLHLGCPK